MAIDWNEFLKTLGITPEDKAKKNLTTGDINKAWKKKVQEVHPDKEGGDEEEFIKVMHAYKMLTDPSYANEQASKRNGNQTPDNFDVVITHVITFEKAFFGGESTLRYNRVHLDQESEAMVNPKDHEEIIELRVMVPPGCQQGHPQVFGGKGFQCGSRFGAAKVTIVPQQHQRFKMIPRPKNPRIIDVRCVEEVPLDIMICGGELEVPTMYGLSKVKLKPGTKPGDTYAVPKRGVAKKGDHIITIEAHFPDQEELREDKWSGLDIDWGVMTPDKADAEAEILFRQLLGNPEFTITTDENGNVSVSSDDLSDEADDS